MYLFLLFLCLSCCTAIFQSSPICPRHPGLLWEVIKRLAAHQLHGESHPSRGSHATAPIACDGSRRQGRFNARTLGWTGVSLSPLPIMADTGSYPVLTADCFSLPARQNKPKTFIRSFRWCLAVPVRQILAQPLSGLWLSPKKRECA